jgi:hypothetical protein
LASQQTLNQLFSDARMEPRPLDSVLRGSLERLLQGVVREPAIRLGLDNGLGTLGHRARQGDDIGKLRLERCLELLEQLACVLFRDLAANAFIQILNPDLLTNSLHVI